MLDDRKASILRAVVEEYIHTAQPVGSGHVAAAPEVAVSPATVRNDMATLEAEGYLAQPHTSAGRIPTDAGYRYYVDHLTGRTSLDRSSAQQVRSFFDRTHGELERMLADTSRLLSGLTGTAAVVTGPPQHAAVVRSVQLVGLTPRLALLVVVLSNGAVEKATVELGGAVDDPTDADLAAAEAHLREHLVGQHLSELATVPAPADPATSEGVLAAVAAASRAAEDGPDGDHLYVGGTDRMAGAFEAVETVREVLGLLEQQLVVVTLLRDVLDRGLQVAIGAETGMAPLAECALVVAPYEIEGEPVGSVGVLGPTRMDYAQALAAVAVVGQRLGRRLSEG
ncbi:heat-inducible transcriptional repressor HrcA [Iamia majanohamensis]|uniref:Heat-inducible transcription repressor HrcA n=1 Tax=Iamia majanohamensis TaxID=467976 RepID=A0AAE9Y745_9ACTN|nr:heat-inducible transcriptional repressor HrcA [Iamia majanohamensis]WCO65613.1 heat-inducible transcriptional repressor HrcA [Iamia majanohamensis]